MRIAVCDDVQADRSRLVVMLSEFCAARSLTARCDEYESGEALLGEFSPDLFSLIFLDIYMNGMTGVDTARALREVDPNCVIIFTTSSAEHGADAFDVDAFHYLVKPVGGEKLFTVLGKWYDALCETKTIELKCGRASRQVFIRDILYIDVQGRSSTVHTAAERIETSMTLSAPEEALPGGQFCRPIRYCLAALAHIQTVTDEAVLLDNGETLTISRREKENLRGQLASYRLRQLRRR